MNKGCGVCSSTSKKGKCAEKDVWNWVVHNIPIAPPLPPPTYDDGPDVQVVKVDHVDDLLVG